MRLIALVLVPLALSACGAPRSDDEVGSESESTSAESGESDSSTGDGSTNDSLDTVGDVDLPVDDECLEPAPGQLCLHDAGFLVTAVKPSTILIEDVDGDEQLDLLAISVVSSLVRVAPGQGEGSFGDWIDSTLAKGIRGAALGQIDEDGDLDLVLANLVTPAGMAIAYGDGQARFSPPQFKSSGSAPRAVAIGAIDEDAWMDVVIADEDGAQVFVMLGDGLGGLSTSSTLPVGVEPYDLALVDLDLDDQLDVATVDHGSDTISVLWGEGGRLRQRLGRADRRRSARDRGQRPR